MSSNGFKAMNRKSIRHPKIEDGEREERKEDKESEEKIVKQKKKQKN